MEIVVFSTRNLTVINSVNYKYFLTKFCTIVTKLFSIISCKCCLNGLRFCYFITTRVGLQFFCRTHCNISAVKPS